jgi:hypothetical protein
MSRNRAKPAEVKNLRKRKFLPLHLLILHTDVRRKIQKIAKQEKRRYILAIFSNKASRRTDAVIAVVDKQGWEAIPSPVLTPILEHRDPMIEVPGRHPTITPLSIMHQIFPDEMVQQCLLGPILEAERRDHTLADLKHLNDLDVRLWWRFVAHWLLAGMKITTRIENRHNNLLKIASSKFGKNRYHAVSFLELPSFLNWLMFDIT